MIENPERSCGVIFLGASRFPYKKDLDKFSFAAAKQAMASVLTPDYLLTDRVDSLDLFDKEYSPVEIVDQVSNFLTAHPKLNELIIYYCGHGGFLPGPAFYLTLRSTREGREAMTGLSLKQFRLDLEDLLLDKRIYLVLDCCYAAAAVDDWQADGVKDVIVNDVESAFPPSGTALIAAASRKTPAIAPEERETTLFTGHFVEAIRAGVKDQRQELSFADLAECVYKRIRNEPMPRKVLPELHVPRQSEGDVSRVPFVRNLGSVRSEKPQKPAWDPLYPSNIKVTLTTPSFAIFAPPASLPPTPQKLTATEQALLAASANAPSADPTADRPVARRRKRKRPETAVSAETALATATEPAEPAIDQSPQPTAPEKHWVFMTLARLLSKPWIDSAVRLPRAKYAAVAVLVPVVAAFYVLYPWSSSPGVLPIDRPVAPSKSPVGLPSTESTVLAPTISLSSPVAKVPDLPSHKQSAEMITPKSAAAAGTAYCGSPDTGEMRLASAGGPIVPTNIKINPILSDARELRAVALAPDQTLVATGGDDGRVRLWDAASFKLNKVLAPASAGTIYALDFAYSNSMLLLASASDDGIVRIWDASAGRLIHKFDAISEGRPVKQYGVAFSPRINPTHAYSAGEDGLVRKWDMRPGPAERPVEIRTDYAAIRSLSVPPGGRSGFATGSWAGAVTFSSDTGSGNPIKAFSRLTLRVAYSPDGTRLLASGRDAQFKNIKLWNTEGETFVRSFDGHKDYVVSVTWSPDGKKIASGGGGKDTSVRVWDSATGAQLGMLTGHRGDVEATTFAKHDSRLVTVSEDKFLRVWDVAGEKELMALVPFSDGTYVAFTPDGCYSGPQGIERHFKLSVNGQEKPIDAGLKSALFNPDGFAFLTAR